MENEELREHQIKERLNIQRANDLQNNINMIRQQEYERQNRPPSPNIFTRMKDAFERNSVDEHLQRHRLEHLKKEALIKAKEAQSHLIVNNFNNNFRAKMNHENALHNHKIARNTVITQRFTRTDQNVTNHSITHIVSPKRKSPFNPKRFI